MSSDFSQKRSAAEYKMVREGNGLQWLTLFKAGDESVFKEIYDANKVALYSFALRSLEYNITEAEDITAHAFAKLWTNREHMDEPSHIRPWLFKVAKNAICDLKGRNWRIKSTDPAKTPEVIAEDNAYDLEIVHAEVIDMLMKEIEDLPDKVREVFKSSFFDKKSGQQVALELGISESKVSRIKQKAYLLLRTALFKKGLI